MSVPQMLSMDAQETQLPVDRSSIQLEVPELELLASSPSSMEELRLEPSFQKEIGSGQQSGCSHNMRNLAHGQYQVRSTLWSLVEMMLLVRLVAATPLHQPSTGELTMLTTNTNRPHNSMSTQQIFLMTSISMDYSGLRMECSHTLTLQTIKFLKLMYPSNHSGKNLEVMPGDMTIHGKMKTIQLHSTVNSSSFSMLPSVEPMDTSQMDSVVRPGPRSMVSMTKRTNGGLLGITQQPMTLPCRLIQSMSGTLILAVRTPSCLTEKKYQFH